jgi:hypothetical protein
MTIRIPKGVLIVGALLVVAGLAFGAYLIGRSNGGSGRSSTSAAHAQSVKTSGTVAQAPQLPCTDGSAERAVINSDVPHFIVGAHGLTPHPFFGGTAGYRIIILRCADVTGDGQNEMVIGIGAGASGTVFNWAIFTPANGRWSLAFHQEGQRVSDLKVQGGEVQEIRPIYGPGDALCCPSGHRVSKVKWDGNTFSVGPAVGQLPGYQDCGPVPPPPGSPVGTPGRPDLQVRGVDCGTAIAAARQDFHGYFTCGSDPPPKPPAALKRNPPNWTDYCRASKRIIEAAE